MNDSDTNDLDVGGNAPPTGPGDGSRAVAIGGGHGLSRCLQALAGVVDHVTAIVTVADDGGSSGRLRRALGVLPPGDLRMALTALSPRRDLSRLVQYRFGAGELDGHSLGNLLIVATTDLNDGDVVAALDYVAAVLDARGRVLPCTTASVQLHARVADRHGDVHVAGQVTVAQSSRVQEVWLQPQDPPATPAAVAAIRRADLIVLGPGSLYTSIIPNLLVPGVGDAVAGADAPLIYVANLREQQGETEGLDLEAHVVGLLEHTPELELSGIVAHRGRTPPGVGRGLSVDETVLKKYTPEILVGDYLDPRGGHDPEKLRTALEGCLR